MEQEKVQAYEKKDIVWSVDQDLCKSCGLCIEKCPVKCLSFDLANNQYLGLPTIKCDIAKCIGCQNCAKNCPDCAILVNKR